MQVIPTCIDGGKEWESNPLAAGLQQHQLLYHSKQRENSIWTPEYCIQVTSPVRGATTAVVSDVVALQLKNHMKHQETVTCEMR